MISFFFSFRHYECRELVDSVAVRAGGRGAVEKSTRSQTPPSPPWWAWSRSSLCRPCAGSTVWRQRTACCQCAGVKAKINPKTEFFIAFYRHFNHYFMFNYWKIADIQAHSAALGAALRACRSAIFLYRKKREKKEKCVQVFEYFDPILWMSSKCFFYKSSGSKLFHIKNQTKSNELKKYTLKDLHNVNNFSKIADASLCICYFSIVKVWKEWLESSRLKSFPRTENFDSCK